MGTALNRFHVTITYSYDVPDDLLLKDYDTIDPEEGARIDQNNLNNMPHYIQEQFLEAEDGSITVRAERL